MSKVKSLWATPQLIVLARGMPEESVLLHCKTMNPNQPNPGQLELNQDTCAYGNEKKNCANCQSRAMGS